MSHEESALEASRESLYPATILPLISGKGNQQLLLEWIADHEQYTLADPEEPVESVSFDCCILDGESLKAHADVLNSRKEDANPVLEPYLLLLPETDISVMELDQGEVADSILFDTVDEIVSLPIKTAELEWRTESLLRLRAQSQQVRNQKRSLELFKQATEAAGHAVYITDTDGIIEYVNPALEEITGYTAETAIGETPALFNSGDMDAGYFKRLWDSLSEGDVWKEDLINRRKDGETYHAHQTIAPVDTVADGERKFVAIQSDITERVESKQRLKMFRDIVEHIEDPIMLQDRSGVFQVVNTALTEHADRSRETLLGADEYAFMDKASARYIETRKQLVLENEEMVQYRLSPELPTGSHEMFSTLRYPYYGERGDLLGTIAICRNVTDLKTRNDQLAVIDRVLRHNLRNSMTSIKLFAEELAESLPGKNATYANRIDQTAIQINRLVEKERRITKFLLNPPPDEVIDLVDTVKTVSERVGDRYPAATVDCELPESCPIRTTAAIAEALEELLENGIRHSETEQSTVTVRVACNESTATLAVADNGPGIPEMERDVLIGGQSENELYHGGGLGVWLVNTIVTHSGGTIELSPSDADGTTVTLRFAGP